ncbi:MAG TPA: class E sortase [Acidimicrobiia bacterium]|nr:class E sortase [Acidimicrobiia bacterium]
MRYRRAVVASIAGMVLACGGAATLVAVTDGPSAHALAPRPATTSTVPTTSTTTRPTTTSIRLPQPSPPPADPYANVAVTQIGTILIPKINLVHPIFEGVWLTVVDHGPGHWPGSAAPGHVGNAVFAGHRVTHTHPFLDLDQLAIGDHVIFDMADGQFTYAVTSITIVLPTDIAITDPTRTPTITLFACNPKHSAAQRIVVKGKLISSQPTKPPAAAKTSA